MVSSWLQYKFRPASKLQPYEKIGIGAYALQEKGTDPTFLGGGFNFAVGAYYFFSRHFGIGAEFIFKDIEYSKQSRTVYGDEIVTSTPQSGFQSVFDYVDDSIDLVG